MVLGTNVELKGSNWGPSGGPWDQLEIKLEGKVGADCADNARYLELLPDGSRSHVIYEPGTILLINSLKKIIASKNNEFNSLIHLVLITTQWNRYYDYPHFVAVESEAQRSRVACHTAAGWCSWDLSPDWLWFLRWAPHFCGIGAMSLISQSRKPGCELRFEFSSDCLKVHIISSLPDCPDWGRI